MRRIGKGYGVLAALLPALLLAVLAVGIKSLGLARGAGSVEESKGVAREPQTSGSAQPRSEEKRTMDFDSIEYLAIYGGMPQAAARLNLKGDGDATVRFDGNGDSPSRNSPLFPKQGPVTRAGMISAEQRQAICAALASAEISGSIGLQPAVGPIASGRATIVREGRSLSVEFPLYEPTARFQPLRDALGAAIASLLAAP